MKYLILSILFAPLANASWLEITPDHFNGVYNTGEVPKLHVRVFGTPTSQAYSFELAILPPGGSWTELPIESSHSAYVAAPIALGEHDYQVRLKLLGPGTDLVLEEETLELRGI